MGKAKKSSKAPKRRKPVRSANKRKQESSKSSAQVAHIDIETIIERFFTK